MRAMQCMVLVALMLDTLPAGAEAVDAQAASPPRAEARSDDQITLKSGRILQGVKVIGETPFKLVLEVIPALEPLEIPARQVVSIRYGARSPEGMEATKPEPSAPEESTPQVLQAVKTSPDLLKKLSAPMTEETVEFRRQDLLNTLRSAGILFGVPVTFGSRLESLPLEERIVSLKLPEGGTFEDFIQDSLALELPWLTVEYRYDTIHFDRT